MRYAIRLMILCVLHSVQLSYAATPTVQMRTVRGEFSDIKERVVMALENRGLVLNYTARVGEMLDRTGRDLGVDRRVYDKAESLEFCSAAISRGTMEADPRNIAFCPYAISIYTLPRSPGAVYVVYRVPEISGTGSSADALRRVEKLLSDIVAEALQ